MTKSTSSAKHHQLSRRLPHNPGCPT